jgi:hypothetical protein
MALVRTDVSEELSTSIMVEALSSSKTSVLTRASSQKTPFFNDSSPFKFPSFVHFRDYPSQILLAFLFFTILYICTYI